MPSSIRCSSCGSKLITCTVPSDEVGRDDGGAERVPRGLDQLVEVLGCLCAQRERLEDPDQVADRDALVEQRLEHPLHLAEAELSGGQLVDDDRVRALDDVGERA